MTLLILGTLVDLEQPLKVFVNFSRFLAILGRSSGDFLVTLSGLFESFDI